MANDAGPQVEVVVADTPALVDTARVMFREYAAALGVDLCFQNFESELAGLPGDYAPPGGALLVALVDGQPAGCGAWRPLPDFDYPHACPMKRVLRLTPSTLRPRAH